MTPASYGTDYRVLVAQHDKDLYRGDDRKSGICTRLETIELSQETLQDSHKRICDNLRTITFLVVAMLLTMIGDLVMKVMH